MFGRKGRRSVYNRSNQTVLKDKLRTMRTTRKGPAQPEAGAKSFDPGAPTSNGKFSLISEEKLIGLYKNLLKYRDLNRERNGSSNGRRRSTRGCEAAVVGTAFDLGPGDVVYSLDRGLLTGLTAGNAIETMLMDAEHRGGNEKTLGGMNGTSGSSSVHTVLGAALANKTAKNGKIAVVYITGTNSDSLGTAVHIASVHGLPIIFVRHQDGEPVRGGDSAKLKPKKGSAEETPWFPIITVDIHDVVAIYRVANEAMSRARLGRGPTLIDCQPFLLNAKADLSADPVLNMEHYLRAKGLFDPELKGDTVAEKIKS